MLGIFYKRCGRPWETHHRALPYARNDWRLYDEAASGPKIFGIPDRNTWYVISTVAPVGKSGSRVRENFEVSWSVWQICGFRNETWKQVSLRRIGGHSDVPRKNSVRVGYLDLPGGCCVSDARRRRRAASVLLVFLWIYSLDLKLWCDLWVCYLWAHRSVLILIV